LLNPEIIEMFAGSKQRGQPSRLLAATGPRLLGLGGIPVFGKHARIGASLVPRNLGSATQPQLLQSMLKLPFISGNTACES
jgi:hypothetical protein